MITIPDWPKVALWQGKREHNLNNMYKILDSLGNPEKKLPKTIHIAGTNGKGSSQAFLKSIFTAAGFKVHSYTSPHLVYFNERINLSGDCIGDDHLNELLARVKFSCEKLSIEPTFFEGTTAAALLAFSETLADILILETGIGGRVDPTNAIEEPIITLITPISYDHMEFLGGTIESIAQEKAGIIKTGVPCIISAQDKKVYDILLAKCEEFGAPSFCYEYDYGINILANEFDYLSQKYHLRFPKPSLLGDHQILNAAGAIATIMMVNDQFKITAEQITIGITNTVWPGRIQKIDPATYSHLAAENIQIYLDGAHNNGGAEVLANWMMQYLSEPTYLVIGMTRGRDPVSFCNFFRSIIKEGRTVTVKSEASAHSATYLAQEASKTGVVFKESDSLQAAIGELAALSVNQPVNIVIAGSLFLVADFLKLL